MSLMTGNIGFQQYKQKTKRTVKVPGNVRDTIPIHSIAEDGIFEIEPGEDTRLFDRVYLLEDINYTLKDEKEKEAVLLTLCKILNSINVDFKIIVSNAGRDMEQFYQEIFYPEDGVYGKLGRNNNEWIKEGLKRGKPEICQTRYLVLTVRKKNYEEAKAYFIGLDAILEPLFEAVKSRLEPMNAVERLRTLFGMYRHGKESRFSWSWDSMIQSKRNWKNEILPSYMESHKDYIEIDGKYVSVLFALTLPNSLDESKVMAELGNLTFPSMITLDHAPIPRIAVRNKLMAAGRNNERAIHMEQERHMKAKNFVAGVSYEKQKKKEEIEGYLEQLDDNDENGYFFSMLVTVLADSEEELRNRIEAVRFIGEGLGGIEFVTYNFRQMKAFHTALPIGAREVDCMRCMLTSSLVAFQPFYSKDIIHPGGQFCGINRVTQNIVMLDRKRLKNGNGVISGHTGSGKSMFLKSVEIVQTLIGSEDDVFAMTYWYRKGKVHHEKYAHRTWEATTIKTILANQMYTGDMVQGKKQKCIAEGRNTQKKQKEEDYVIVPNTHEALIDRSLFDKVQKICRKELEANREKRKKYTNVSSTEDLLKNKIFSAEGLKMYRGRNVYKNERVTYNYVTSKSRKNDGSCYKFVYISEEKVFQALKKAIYFYIELLFSIEDGHMDRKRKEKAEIEQKQLQKEIANSQKNVEWYTRRLADTYKEKTEGKIQMEDYIKKQTEYRACKEAAQEKIKELSDKYEIYKMQLLGNPDYFAVYENFLKTEELNKMLIDVLVKKITVAENAKIEITFQFEDEMRMLYERLKESCSA